MGVLLSNYQIAFVMAALFNKESEKGHERCIGFKKIADENGKYHGFSHEPLDCQIFDLISINSCAFLSTGHFTVRKVYSITTKTVLETILLSRDVTEKPKKDRSKLYQTIYISHKVEFIYHHDIRPGEIKKGTAWFAMDEDIDCFHSHYHLWVNVKFL